MKNGMHKGSVLIVEDDRLLTLVTERLLTKLGYTVVGTVQSAREAIDAVRETSADAVLMDISLDDEMSGIEAARRIREFSDIPLIFLSGSSDESTYRQAAKVGMTDFLIKPISADDLVDPLNQAMEESRSLAFSEPMNRAG